MKKIIRALLITGIAILLNSCCEPVEHYSYLIPEYSTITNKDTTSYSTYILGDNPVKDAQGRYNFSLLLPSSANVPMSDKKSAVPMNPYYYRSEYISKQVSLYGDHNKKVVQRACHFSGFPSLFDYQEMIIDTLEYIHITCDKVFSAQYPHSLEEVFTLEYMDVQSLLSTKTEVSSSDVFNIPKNPKNILVSEINRQKGSVLLLLLGGDIHYSYGTKLYLTALPDKTDTYTFTFEYKFRLYGQSRKIKFIKSEVVLTGK